MRVLIVVFVLLFVGCGTDNVGTLTGPDHGASTIDLSNGVTVTKANEAKSAAIQTAINGWRH